MSLGTVGGGSYTPTPYTDMDVTLKNILGDQISGCNTPYDNDFHGSSAVTNVENTIIEHDYDGILNWYMH
ncbi:hypothetical protein NQ314_017984 [Rhamnusium bicolor]|uniref:Uncharacterized protein n=1 Tax=Rhamnusium bicolor TaxID=1586634 RepID=A0AAV8WSC3_9CUCU|nr:hypothetical protein NQ314_017984 [Rhamnusium bicolor]